MAFIQYKSLNSLDFIQIRNLNCWEITISQKQWTQNVHYLKIKNITLALFIKIWAVYRENGNQVSLAQLQSFKMVDLLCYVHGNDRVQTLVEYARNDMPI